ncbi:high mobility group B protein 13-like isoform X2 [Chenopodium quinoa]|uniref:high mobility group B protein 13-like isoform X2 n=1 Tax=Chenopodium quinoa TaxID=63459 RepID=UPI000B783DB4|nr:high mobility group B protein 13-like isoform X2 [Chenopodium quinoa]
MAATATSNLPMASDPVPTKKGRSRKALKEKNPSTNEANILAGKPSDSVDMPALVPESDLTKENNETLSHPRSEKKKSKAKSKAKAKKGEETNDFEKDLQEMQEMLEKMKIEKDKTEEMLKEKDEILKRKEEEQQKLQLELKKLQKMKEFKPTMTLPNIKDQELEKKEKKKKDCSERKRPAAAYALWCKDQWNEIKKENPDADFKEVSNIMGAKWKTLTPEEKKPYEEKYQADKEAYLQIVSKEKREIEAMKLLEEEQKQKTAMELLNQYLEFKQEADKDTKKTKKEKDPLKPKQPMSAFFLYSNERRADLLEKGHNLLEASKIIGEEWKNMSEEQKTPYQKTANINKERYQQEMEVYKQKKDEEAASLKKEEDEFMKIQKVEALQLLKKKEKAENIIKKTKEIKKKNKEEKITDPNKPKRPPSSFFLFSMEERKNLTKERSETNYSTINALISLKWKELSEEEKKVWSEKAAESMVAYKKELEEYNKQLEAKTGTEAKAETKARKSNSQQTRTRTR